MRSVPLEPSTGEEKDLSSLFLATLYPLNDPTEFKTLYDSFKKEHPRADHYPYALSCSGASRSSDDGEPSGTAGRPLLSLLEEKEIDGLIVVARYFGGTKLGVPRLRRAFVASATAAIGKARLGHFVPCFAYALETDYSTYETLRNNAKRFCFEIKEAIFDVKVRLTITSGDRLDGLKEKLGLYDLALGEPTITQTLKEMPL